MKNLILILSLILSTNALAADKTIVLKGTDAGAIIGVFMDAGERPYQPEESVFAWDYSDLSCTYRHNGAYDGLMGGVPSYSCKSEISFFGPSASYAIADQLSKNGAEYDCAMGKCYITAKSVSCSKNLKFDTFVDQMICTIVIEEL